MPCAQSGLTPLHVASYVGDAVVVRELLSAGVDQEAQTTRGEAPLHLAARTGATDVIRALLQHGANIEPRAKVDALI